MAATVEVRFKGNRKDYFLWADEAEPLRLSDPVIVPADRGLDFGRVSAVGEAATKKCASGCSGCAVGETKTPGLAVVRRATQEEIRTANDLRRSEEDTRRTVLDRVRARRLDMKVSDAEWQFDRKKLTVYFTAEKRVDFRELVRDLASVLHTRIDLRQIGARDEAARLSGVGRCGKEYCCSTWLTSLSPVSLALAKDQHLSLNPAQISGGCGRLLCCLKYEHEFYVAARKRFPKEGKALRTSRGAERVVAVDIFRERVFLRSEEQGPRIISLIDLREELERLGEPPPEARGQRPEVAAGAASPRDDRPAADAIARGPRPRGNPPEIAPAAPRPRDDRPARISTDAAPPRDDRPAAGEPPSQSRKRRRRRKRKGPRPDGGGPPSPPPAPET
jgi:cell fate regulator YaaT (PSP1 superfamily)